MVRRQWGRSCREGLFSGQLKERGFDVDKGTGNQTSVFGLRGDGPRRSVIAFRVQSGAHYLHASYLFIQKRHLSSSRVRGVLLR